jgi:hypothetical protein
MSVSGKVRRDRVPARARTHRDRAADLYDRYATGLYRQALLTIDDAAEAEQAVRDVILAECEHPPAPEHGQDDTRRRLALSAYRRCRELAADPARENRRSAGPGGFLSPQERGALGLVLFGGVERNEVCGELMMSPADLAVLLRTALHTLAGPLQVTV